MSKLPHLPSPVMYFLFVMLGHVIRVGYLAVVTLTLKSRLYLPVVPHRMLIGPNYRGLAPSA